MEASTLTPAYRRILLPLILVVTSIWNCLNAAPKAKDTASRGDISRLVQQTRNAWRAYDLDMDMIANSPVFAMPGTNAWGISSLTTGQFDMTPEFRGGTMTARFEITGKGQFIDKFRTYPTPPANCSLWFSTIPGPYNVDLANFYPDCYWWNIGPGQTDLAFGMTTLTGDLNDPSQWMRATDGITGDQEPEVFWLASHNIAEAGLMFGGHFLDTGVQVAGRANFNLIYFGE